VTETHVAQFGDGWSVFIRAELPFPNRLYRNEFNIQPQVYEIKSSGLTKSTKYVSDSFDTQNV
jgi:hypothetical protein